MTKMSGGGGGGGGYSRGASPETGYSEQDEMVLDQAMRTRLPIGSQSPERRRSVSPPAHDDDPTMRLRQGGGLNQTETSPADNCEHYFSHRVTCKAKY